MDNQMFSVKNRSNIRQVTPYGEFGPFEAKTFYPVSSIYANAKTFFSSKTQFQVFDKTLPPVVAKVAPVVKAPVVPVVTEPVVKEPTVETPKDEVAEKPVEPKTDEVKPPEEPVVVPKPKARRSLS
jgi:hypothetical protein